jgi:hypothetical protein
MELRSKVYLVATVLALCGCTKPPADSSAADQWKSRMGDKTVFAAKVDRLPLSASPKIENTIVSLGSHLKGATPGVPTVLDIAKDLSTSVCEDGVFVQIKATPVGLENLRSFVDVSAAMAAQVPEETIPDAVLERVLKSCSPSSEWEIEFLPIRPSSSDAWEKLREIARAHTEFIKKSVFAELDKRKNKSATESNTPSPSLNAPMPDDRRELFRIEPSKHVGLLSCGWVYYGMPLRSPVKPPEIPESTPGGASARKIITAALSDWANFSETFAGEVFAFADFTISREEFQIRANVMKQNSSIDLLKLSEGIKWKRMEEASSQISVALPHVKTLISPSEAINKVASYIGLLSLPSVLESTASLEEKQASAKVEKVYSEAVSGIKSALTKLSSSGLSQINLAVWPEPEVGSAVWGDFQNPESLLEAMGDFADLVGIPVQGKIFPISASGEKQNREPVKLWVMGDSPEWAMGRPVLGRHQGLLSISTTPTSAEMALNSQSEPARDPEKVYLRAVLDISSLAQKNGIPLPYENETGLFAREKKVEITAIPVSSNMLEVKLQTIE